jgi:integrase
MVKKPLTPMAINNLKVPEKKKHKDYTVGGVKGLYIRVQNTGSKQWFFRGTFDGKREVVNLGSYPTITLEKARERARGIIDDIYNGINPFEKKREEKRTFKALTYEYFENKKVYELKTERDRKSWIRELENHVLPYIGDRNIKHIHKNHIVEMLNKIWLEKPVLAKRVLQRTEKIFSYAGVLDLIPNNHNPAKWNGYLSEIMPRQKHKTEHFPSLDPELVPDLVQELKQRLPDIVTLAGLTAICCGLRIGEVVTATWENLNFEEQSLFIPAKNHKTSSDCIVGVPDEIAGLLKKMPKLGDYIFHSVIAKNGHIAPRSVLHLFTRIYKKSNGKYKDSRTGRKFTTHGFRATLKEWAANYKRYKHRIYQDDISERILTHRDSNKSREPYHRSELIEMQIELLNDYNDFCNKRAKYNVIEFNTKRGAI